MDLKTRLNRTLEWEHAAVDVIDNEDVSAYEGVARCYARLESAIAVLSDMKSRTSLVFYGGVARELGIAATEGGRRIDSIWEEDILGRIHPDDLEGKYLGELNFFRFVEKQPPARRERYCLVSHLRMMSADGAYIPMVHRMFYIYDRDRKAVRLALCLYNRAIDSGANSHLIVDTVTGTAREACPRCDERLLSRRETEILRLVDKGMPSKTIAETLSISVNTVSRHRQEILAKLQVRNSIEACRLANRLNLI